jgi:hypothetical protein
MKGIDNFSNAKSLCEDVRGWFYARCSDVDLEISAFMADYLR